MKTKKAASKPTQQKPVKVNRVLRINSELDEWLCSKSLQQFGEAEPQPFIRSVLWDLFQAEQIAARQHPAA